MRETERLSAEVDRTVAGDPWYGPSVLKTLEGIDAAAAARHPVPGVHSVWELVLHMTAWAHETTRRLQGGPDASPAEGDWQLVSGTGAAAWNEAIAALRSAHRELAETLSQARDASLALQVGGDQVDRDGHAVTLHQTVIGLLQHDAYHTGQIALLKKLLVSEDGRSA